MWQAAQRRYPEINEYISKLGHQKKELEDSGEAMEMLSSLVHKAVSIIQIERAILIRTGSSFS